jgi:poly-gamma-glutamate capsule biosynthesis protein CapA/YwtB (metallophosphatase superfamily)
VSYFPTRVRFRATSWLRLAVAAAAPLMFLALASGIRLPAWNAAGYAETAPWGAQGLCRPESSALFFVVGDIMLSRGVERMMARSGDPTLPFRDLSAQLRWADFNFGNLESPVSGNDSIAGKGLVFNARVRALKGLADTNFRVVSLANNHALDQGRRGLRTTIDQLRARGIAGVGAGEDLNDAWRPQVVEANGIRIAFIAASYASVNDNGRTRNYHVARTDDQARLAAAVSSARASADFVVVSMHAGVEYTRRPNTEQVTFAHAAVDAGADLVVGAHPHWVQPSEIYRDTPIYYSLGNFIFDQQQPGTRDGLILKVNVLKEVCGNEPRFRLLPIMEAAVSIEGGGIPRLN